MALQEYFDDISFTPFKKELYEYSHDELKSDLFAAISVALLTLPQAMAYALVAGVPPSCAFFASIFSPLIAALFGSSRHLIVGPSNAIAILIQFGTAEILQTFHPDAFGAEREMIAMQVMCQLTLLVGVMHLFAAGFKLGHLTQFVSYTVVIGYVCGASVTIFVTQLFVFFGIPPLQGVHSLFERAIYFISHLQELHIATLGIGFFSLLVLFLIKRFDSRLPAGVITFLLAAFVAWVIGLVWQGPGGAILLVGDSVVVDSLIPTFSMPGFDGKILNELLPVGFAIALLSILETVSVSKAIAANSGQRLSVNQEILGLGLSNLFSAFFGAMPISGSSSRSALNYSSGAKTRFASMLSATFVGLIVVVFAGVVKIIPTAALSALLLVTAGGILKKKQLLLCLKATKHDSFVFWATFLSAIFLSIDMAFYIGVFISITLYLKKAAIPHLMQYTIDAQDRFRALGLKSQEAESPIRVIKVKGELFFGAADLFQTTLKSIAEDDTKTKVIILQLKNARDLDATACLALHQLHDYLIGSGRFLLLSGITLSTWEIFSNSAIVQAVGKDKIFLIDETNPHLYMQKTIAKARELVEQKVTETQEEVSILSAMAENKA